MLRRCFSAPEHIRGILHACYFGGLKNILSILLHLTEKGGKLLVYIGIIVNLW